MDKNIVLKLNNHNIYYIKTDKLSYFISIPKNYQETKICIELKSKMNNYNLDVQDDVWVMENVKNTYSYIDLYNITLVIPILSDSERDILEKMDTEKFELLDRLLGHLINNAYLSLKEEKIKVENEVIMINNDRYKVFINWFTTRYKSRMKHIELLELIRVFNVNATSYKKLETPVITYVVGSYNQEIDVPKIEEPPEPVIKLEPAKASSGFTSYWLLLVITLIIALSIALVVFLMKYVL